MTLEAVTVGYKAFEGIMAIAAGLAADPLSVSQGVSFLRLSRGALFLSTPRDDGSRTP